MGVVWEVQTNHQHMKRVVDLHTPKCILHAHHAQGQANDKPPWNQIGWSYETQNQGLPAASSLLKHQNLESPASKAIIPLILDQNLKAPKRLALNDLNLHLPLAYYVFK